MPIGSGGVWARVRGRVRSGRRRGRCNRECILVVVMETLRLEVTVTNFTVTDWGILGLKTEVVLGWRGVLGRARA